MIVVIPDYVDSFISFINNKHLVSEPVYLTILYGYDSIGAEDGESGFGAYNPQTKSIMIADPNVLKSSFGLSDEDAVDTTISNIAHEYFHHIQFCKNEANTCDVTNHCCNENDAELFSDTIVKEYKNNNK